jgi:glucose-6-phosphate isomerase
VCYQPAFGLMGEWLMQLSAKARAKKPGPVSGLCRIYPPTCTLWDKFIQRGSPVLFETVVDLGEPRRDLTISGRRTARTGFEFFAGRTLEEVNRTAMAGARCWPTAAAH